MTFSDLLAAGLNRLVTPAPKRPLGGLVLGRAVDPPHRGVHLPDRFRAEHVVICGKTGVGKTYLLESLACQIAARGEGLTFFDFHGDASLSLIERLLELPDARERLIVLDPSHPTRSPGINVLECGASDAERFRKVSELSSILRQRWGVDSFGARTEELLRNSLYTLAVSGRTLADLPGLLTKSDFRDALTAKVTHSDIQQYWRVRYEPLSEAMKAAFREPLLNRVTAFLTDPAARHLLAQPTSTIDISRVMQERQWLIVRLPKGQLREHAHTIGNLLFAQVQFAAFAREALPVNQRPLFTLLYDEVQNLVENDLSSLLSESRKFNVSVITAMQFWDQLPRELRGALLSAASHICFRVSSADAGILASELSPERRHRLSGDLTRLTRGEAIARIGTHPVEQFRVSQLPSIRPVSAETLERLITPVTRSRDEIEQHLRPTRPSAAPVRAPIDLASSPPAPSVPEGQHEW